MYEYVKRGTLSRMMRKMDHNLPLELVRFYAAELVLIMEKLHSESIIHRDLKPQNVLIDQDYHLKLVRNSSNSNFI